MQHTQQTLIDIRRVFTQVEDVFHEFGPAPSQPLRRGAVVAVLKNPYAGRYEADILPMMEALQPVGLEMARTLLQAMAVSAARIESYGKGAIVGAAGELEHGALWHVPGGYAMRELLGWKDQRPAAGNESGDKAGSSQVGAAQAGNAETGNAQAAKAHAMKAQAGNAQAGNALAIVPSTKKVGPPGAALDVPLTHINAAYVRSHFDAFEVRVPGAPLPDEIAVILAMSTGARVHARVGGLAAADIARWDGLR